MFPRSFHNGFANANLGKAGLIAAQLFGLADFPGLHGQIGYAVVNLYQSTAATNRSVSWNDLGAIWVEIKKIEDCVVNKSNFFNFEPDQLSRYW